MRINAGHYIVPLHKALQEARRLKLDLVEVFIHFMQNFRVDKTFISLKGFSCSNCGRKGLCLKDTERLKTLLLGAGNVCLLRVNLHNDQV